jgi:hypothetical protein
MILLLILLPGTARPPAYATLAGREWSCHELDARCLGSAEGGFLSCQQRLLEDVGKGNRQSGYMASLNESPGDRYGAKRLK